MDAWIAHLHKKSGSSSDACVREVAKALVSNVEAKYKVPLTCMTTHWKLRNNQQEEYKKRWAQPERGVLYLHWDHA
eukprot:3206339-Prorocentrum_lima.AAC.1